MTDKELKEKLQKLKELLENSSSEKENDNSTEKSNESKQVRNKSKTLGGHPSVGNLKMVPEDSEHQKGYSSAFMLAFLTFFFQTIFILIAYLIFK